MSRERVRQWVLEHPLSPAHVDCATAVMLKILDGKCKMDAEEKVVMALLYDEVKHQPGAILGEDIHALIETARHSHEDDEIREFVYEKRVLAEMMISRPVMKGFKGMIRAEGGVSLRYGWFEFPRFESCQFIQTILEFTFI